MLFSHLKQYVIIEVSSVIGSAAFLNHKIECTSRVG